MCRKGVIVHRLRVGNRELRRWGINDRKLRKVGVCKSELSPEAFIVLCTELMIRFDIVFSLVLNYNISN